MTRVGEAATSRSVRGGPASMESYGANDFRAKHPLGCEELGVTTLRVRTAEQRAQKAGASRGANQARQPTT